MTRSSIPIDKVYLLASKDADRMVKSDIHAKLKSSEEEIGRILSANGISWESVRVESWNFDSVIEAILDIAAKERSAHGDAAFHINFTSGTHVMAGAACCAAFYIGADVYYVMNRKEHEGLDAEEEVRVFEMPDLPNVGRIKGLTKDALLIIHRSGSISNRELMEQTNLSPSKQGYHTRILKEMGLIEKDAKGTEAIWSISYSGRIASKILMRTTQTPERYRMHPDYQD